LYCHLADLYDKYGNKLIVKKSFCEMAFKKVIRKKEVFII